MDKLIYGASRSFRDTVDLAKRYGKSPWPVLITGETGVGKEGVAQLVHESSDRRKERFTAVNCGALPLGLVESELFGYERGAFSGAAQSSRGLVRQARGGTLFLDEVGDLDFPSQVKLLRLLDSGEVRSLGGEQSEKVDIRIIAATNVDLVTAVREKRFRHDLLERLSVLPLQLPPLRNRREDIFPLAQHFAAIAGTSMREDTETVLLQYEWPGNIRQLRNTIIRASFETNTTIGPNLLRRCLEREKGRGLKSGNQSPYTGTLEEIEKRAIVDRLRLCQGNRKQTAKELGIAKSTLHEKLRKWNEHAPMPWPAGRHSENDAALLSHMGR